MTPSSSNILGKRVHQIDSSYQPSQFMRLDESLSTKEKIKNYIEFYGIRFTGQAIGVSVENLKERVKELGIPAKNFSILPTALQEFLLQAAFESGGFFKNNSTSFGFDGAVSILEERQLHETFDNLVNSDEEQKSFNCILSQFKINFYKIETKNQLKFLTKLNQSLRVDFLFSLIKESDELNEQNQNFLEGFFQICYKSYINKDNFQKSDIRCLLDRLNQEQLLEKFFKSKFLTTKDIYLEKPYHRCYLFECLLKMGYGSPDFVDALLEKRIEQDESVDISDAAKKALVLMTNISLDKKESRLKCFHSIIEGYLGAMKENDFFYQSFRGLTSGNTLLHQAASLLNWLDVFPSIVERAPSAAYFVKNKAGLTPIGVLRKIQERKNIKPELYIKIGDMIKKLDPNAVEIDQMHQLPSLLEIIEEEAILIQNPFEEFFS
ncbi:MAG: hypothetical protein ChlgKO_09060 [Chlamydiales bacterium]